MRANTGRPVLAVARNEPRLAVFDAAQHPVAVVLDLVQPVGPGRRARDQRREHRRQHRRRLGGLRAFHVLRRRASCGVAAFALLPVAAWLRQLGNRAGLHVLLHRQLRLPDARSRRGDFLQAASGRHAVRRGRRRWTARPGARTRPFLDQQPRLVAGLAAVLAAARAHQRPAALQLLAVELELEMALRVAGDRIFLRRPRAAIPEHARCRRRIAAPG